MTTPINPTTLKFLRGQKHWTQEQLSEATKGKSKVSIPTIKRIESKKGGDYSANARVAESLAKAFGVKIEELSQLPTEQEDFEAKLREDGYRPLRQMIDSETALAYNIVHHLYGISPRSQIEMAPLFAALLAEASLTWRLECVEEIEKAAESLMTLGNGHFAFANAAYRTLDGVAAEREAIEKRDLFGEQVGDEVFDLGYDASQNNPFADFLEHLAKKVEAKNISFEKGGGWKTSEGLPEYRVGADIIDELTDLDLDAEYALLRGHVRIKDLPSELLSADKVDERVAWMIARIPEDELFKINAKRARLSELIVDFELGGALQSPDETAGGNHA